VRESWDFERRLDSCLEGRDKGLENCQTFPKLT